MRILITGADGFVGRACCAHLARHGIEVVAAVRGSTGAGAASEAAATGHSRIGDTVEDGNAIDDLELAASDTVMASEKVEVASFRRHAAACVFLVAREAAGKGEAVSRHELDRDRFRVVVAPAP